jgi:putative nucleotidyltransferase with HDIG domain
MSSTIAVEELRVGMYIQLEGGWLSHPFPLSSFRIATDDQISTLRSLGLTSVRWVPERSDAADHAGLAWAVVDGTPPPAVTPADLAQTRQQTWLDAQREAALRCERQHAEAAKAWREAYTAVTADPALAGENARVLAQAMLEKTEAADEVAIRLVAGSSDRTATHALNVAVISMLIGRSLGLTRAELIDLGVGALLHDVGKIEVLDRFRQLEAGFSAAEVNAYREHVARGLQLGQRMDLAPAALAIIAQHHEHADGSGFPQGLGPERMSIGARIVAIVNRYDDLCNPLTRVASLTPHEAVATLFAHERSRCDPTVLNTFIRMMGVYPAGSLVQLTDDRYAQVVGVNSSRPLKPRVLVVNLPGDRTRRDEEATTRLVDLQHMPDLGIRRSLPAGKLPPAALQALDPRPRMAYFFEPLGRAHPAQELAA